MTLEKHIENNRRTENMGISFGTLEWAHKMHGRATVNSADVYLSTGRGGKTKQYVFYFRTAKLPSNADYMQVARFGNLLLFKMSDSRSGWKLSNALSLQSTRSLQISESALSQNIKALLDAHIHEGFDLQYEVKENIYYIDTSNGVENEINQRR